MKKSAKPEWRLIGTWVSSLPYDSDDYLVEYKISQVGKKVRVEARDLQDGEKMRISKVRRIGNSIEFVSLMPSTKRKGLNKFKLSKRNELQSEFTFTVYEKLKRLSDSDEVYSDRIRQIRARSKR